MVFCSHLGRCLDGYPVWLLSSGHVDVLTLLCLFNNLRHLLFLQHISIPGIESFVPNKNIVTIFFLLVSESELNKYQLSCVGIICFSLYIKRFK